MKNRGFSVVMVLVIFAIRVSAETITIDLPQFKGQYIRYTTLTAAFDLGTKPASISQARIRFQGTFYPGLAYWWDEPGLLFPYGDSLWSIMDPPESPGRWEANSEYFDNLSSFSDESTFSWHEGGTPSWVFLLDGQGTVDVRLDGTMPWGYVIVQEAKAYISDAKLIVEIEKAIRLNSPNGNEALLAGTTHTIQWTDLRTGGCSRAYDLLYSTDNGLSWMPLGSVASGCSYDWLLPEIDSNDCLVKVLDANDASVLDMSDRPFTIYHCTLNYDLNGDCFVNTLDLAALASEWLQCGNPFDPNCLSE